ncbi:MAG: hypothetical protein HOW73_06310 [Polyangiaceae bacterium]|nr:hypothetical protein [Polyangiaceae bacterium]
MSATRANVLTHGHCFDGLVSAVLFTRLLSHVDPKPDRVFHYRSCGYGPKLKTIPRGWLAADVNAILDFRYTEDDRLTYYFDHHKTGFSSPREQDTAIERVERSGGRRKLYFDPTCSSCAKLIARVANDTYGLPFEEHRDLIAWADRVDAARFDDPEEAFFGRPPALVLADVVERHGDTPFLARIVPMLCEKTIEEAAASEEIAQLAAPLAGMKDVFLEAVRRAGKMRGDVAVIDLGDASPTPAGKFATYVAFPDCRYSIILIRTKDQLKLGVGFNPWSGKERTHDIATLCQREGGGGHPVVGAVNFAHADLDRARAALERIAAALTDAP